MKKNITNLLSATLLLFATQAQAESFNYLSFKAPSKEKLSDVKKEVLEMSVTLKNMSQRIHRFKANKLTLKRLVTDLILMNEDLRDKTIFKLDQNVFTDREEIETFRGKITLDDKKFYLRRSAEDLWLFSSTYEGLNALDWETEFKRLSELNHQKSDIKSAEKNIAKLSLEVQAYEGRLEMGDVKNLKFDYRALIKSIKDYFTGLGRTLFDVQSSIDNPDSLKNL